VRDDLSGQSQRLALSNSAPWLLKCHGYRLEKECIQLLERIEKIQTKSGIVGISYNKDIPSTTQVQLFHFPSKVDVFCMNICTIFC
jgi:hypothetical protein